VLGLDTKTKKLMAAAAWFVNAGAFVAMDGFEEDQEPVYRDSYPRPNYLESYLVAGPVFSRWSYRRLFYLHPSKTV
jgi:hypothetical protein